MKKDTVLKAAVYTSVFAGFAVLAMAFVWVIWTLWGVAVPYFWPEGPLHVTRPDFIPFAIVWLAFVWALNILRSLLKAGRSS